MSHHHHPYHDGLVTNTSWVGAPTAAGVYPGDCLSPACLGVGRAPALPAPAAVGGRTCTDAAGAPSSRGRGQITSARG